MHTGNGVHLSLNGARRHAESTLEARLAKLERLVEELARSQRNGHQAIGGQPADGGAELHGDDGRVSTTTSAEPGDRPEGQAKEEVALAGQDGAKAEELLKEAKRQGSATLSALLGRALRRHLSNGPQIAGPLFDDAEMAELAKAFEATCGTADLLGRARVREKQNDGQRITGPAHGDADRNGLHGSRNLQPSEHGSPPSQENFAFDQATVNSLTAPLRKEFMAFADVPAIKPFPPARALAYFRRLVPSLDVHPERFGAEQARRAFTLAGNTSLVLREKVQKAIADTLAGGDVPQGEGLVRVLLAKTGCSRANPQYSEMVFRTNMMDSYTQGAEQELRHPDVLPDFPAWQYLGIRDGRQGEDHEQHFDKYFSTSIPFASVRGPRLFNCRCAARPIHKTEWAELQRRGARFSSFGEARPAVRDSHVPREVRHTTDAGLVSYFTERLAFYAGQRFAEQLEAAAAIAEQDADGRITPPLPKHEPAVEPTPPIDVGEIVSGVAKIFDDRLGERLAALPAPVVHYPPPVVVPAPVVHNLPAPVQFAEQQPLTVPPPDMRPIADAMREIAAAVKAGMESSARAVEAMAESTQELIEAVNADRELVRDKDGRALRTRRVV